MEKHTPTPWKLMINGFGKIQVSSSNSEHIAQIGYTCRQSDELRVANSELIVKAVNHHEELVKTTRDLTNLIAEIEYKARIELPDSMAKRVFKANNLLSQLETH